MTVIAILLPTLLGFLILALLFRHDKDAGLLLRICMSYPLGTGLLTFQMFILGLCRVPLTLLYISIPLMIEIVLLAFWLLRSRVPLAPPPDFGLYREFTSSQTNLAKKVAISFLLMWATTKILSIFIETGLRPIYAWDAWANWTAGAKLFYATHSLMLDVPAQDFFTRGAVLRITAYPLHNPLMQMWHGLWNGGFDEVLVKFWTPPYLLVLGMSFYLYASKEIGRISSLTMLVLFLSSPLMSYHAIEVYSDLPLAAYFFLAFISLLQALRGRAQYWFLAGLFCAEALFTKDEALFFVGPLLLSAGMYIWFNVQEWPRRRTALLTLILPFLMIIPWYVFKFSHALGLGADHIKLEFTYHPEILITALQSILSLENFNVIFLFLPILLVLAGRPSKEFWYACLPVVSYAVFFLALYAFTTFYYDHFSKGTVFYRNLLTYYPLATFLVVLLIKQIQSSLVPPATVPVRKRKKA